MYEPPLKVMSTRVSPCYNTTYAIASVSPENSSTLDGTTGAICTLGGVSTSQDFRIGGNLNLGGQLIVDTPTTSFTPTMYALNTTFAYTTQIGYLYTISGATFFFISLIGTCSTGVDGNVAEIHTSIPIFPVKASATSTGLISPNNTSSTKGLAPNTHPYSVLVSPTKLFLFTDNDQCVIDIATTTFSLTFNGMVNNV